MSVKRNLSRGHTYDAIRPVASPARGSGSGGTRVQPGAADKMLVIPNILSDDEGLTTFLQTREQVPNFRLELPPCCTTISA